MNDYTRQAFTAVIAGEAPNGIDPDMCGEYADHVEGMCAEYEAGGPDRARLFLETIAQKDHVLRQVLAAGANAEAAFDREDLPTLPARAYDNLPEILAECCRNIPAWYQRDAFLTAAIGAISALMAKVRFWYDGQPLSLHLFFFILANAGSGKGIITHALGLVEEADDWVVEKSDQDRADWEERNRHYENAKRSRKSELLEPQHPGAKPPNKMIRAAADTNKSVLFKNLEANPEGVLIGSTEADLVSQANKRGEFGDFSSLFRLAFHNERFDKETKGDGIVRVKAPRVALVMAGTLDQFAPLVESVNDGLFSRFSVYRFAAPLEYQSKKPRPADLAFRNAIETARSRLADLYKVLMGREEELYIKMPEDLWDMIDTAVKNLFDRTIKEAGAPRELAASFFRGTVITFRIAMIFTVLRRFEEGVPLGIAKSLEVGKREAEAALALGLTYVEQSMRQALDMLKVESPKVLAAIASSAGADRLTGQQLSFLQLLPEGEFNRKMAVDIGRDLGASPRTIDTWLKAWSEGENAILDRVRQGGYCKTCKISKIPDTDSESPINTSNGFAGFAGFAKSPLGQNRQNQDDRGVFAGFAGFATGGASPSDTAHSTSRFARLWSSSGAGPGTGDFIADIGEKLATLSKPERSASDVAEALVDIERGPVSKEADDELAYRLFEISDRLTPGAAGEGE